MALWSGPFGVTVLATWQLLCLTRAPRSGARVGVACAPPWTTQALSRCSSAEFTELPPPCVSRASWPGALAAVSAVNSSVFRAADDRKRRSPPLPSGQTTRPLLHLTEDSGLRAAKVTGALARCAAPRAAGSASSSCCRDIFNSGKFGPGPGADKRGRDKRPQQGQEPVILSFARMASGTLGSWLLGLGPVNGSGGAGSKTRGSGCVPAVPPVTRRTRSHVGHRGL